MKIRMAIIAAAIRKILVSISGNIGLYSDNYWNSVVLALCGNVPAIDFKSKTVLNMHMDEADQYWTNVALGLHLGNGEDVDPYWSNVVSLMHLNGANSSTAIGDITGKIVTVGGNASISTTQSKFGGASCYFDGTNDYLSIPNSTDFDFSSGAFTIEAWVYLTAYHASWSAVCAKFATTGWRLLISSAGSLHLSTDGGGSTTTSGLISLNTWTHVAVSSTGTTHNLYVNGILYSANATNGITNSTGNLYIGANDASNNFSLTGYIDNLRISKGVCRYTDNFTPLNREFPVGATTIYDVKGKPVTITGNASVVSTQSRFGGYSCYFDGTTDELSIPAAPAIGTGDFTVETWFYVIDFTVTNQTLVCIGPYTTGFLLRFRTGNIDLYILGTGYIQTKTIDVGVWHHIAISRTSGVLKIFFNGEQVGSDITSTHNIPSDAYRIGSAIHNSAEVLKGYMDDVRITNGIGRYTSNFTLPSRAFPHGDAFLDEKGLIPILTGTPSISTGTLKYGTGSASFNGTTDYLTFDASSGFGFGTGNFTMEAWVKTSAIGTLLDLRHYTTDYGHFYITTGGYLAFDSIPGTIVGTTSITDNSWHHIAFVRYNDILTLYVDGIDNGTIVANLNIGSNRQARIAAKVDGTNYFSGNIDQLRLTKEARYVSEFTPQKYSFDDVNNNPKFRDETGTHTVISYGNSNIQGSTVKYGNGAMQFDGTSDYLSIPTSTDFDFGSGDFTIDMWINISSTSASGRSIISRGWLSGAYAPWLIYQVPSSSDILFFASSTGTSWDIVSGHTIKTAAGLNAWNHIAIVRHGSNIYSFFNGSLVTTNTSSTAFTTSTNPVWIGGNTNTSESFHGYIDDLRITKGIARYISAFTAPDRQISNYGKPIIYDPYWDAVVLGLHMDGSNNGTTFTDVRGNTVTANGDAKTVTATKKFGTASAYFDGTGDALTISNSASFNLLGGDFTVEGWIYHLNPTDTTGGVICCVGNATNDYWQMIIRNGTFIINHNYGAGGINLEASVSTSASIWHHFAWTKSDSTHRLFYDGVLLSTTGTGPTGPGTNFSLYIGANFNLGSTSFNGYLDDFRITKGVARYTANFQPDQYAFSEIRIPVKTYLDNNYNNVVLNMHMNGPTSSTAFVDEKGKVFTAYGNASLSSSQSKFGSVSAYFDGTGDYLSTPSVPDFLLGNGNFTIEFWVYPTSLSSAKKIVGIWSDTSGTGFSWKVELSSAGQIYFIHSTTGADSISNYTTIGTVTTNNWQHIAVTRSGSNLYIAHNGCNRLITSSLSSTFYAVDSTKLLEIGRDGAGTTNYFTGYIDDLRITKGIARYTTNFTVSALPNPDFNTIPAATDPYWKNVSLHMPMNGTDGGTTFTDNTGKTITVAGNTSTQVEQYRFGGSSAYFDGTGDYLTVPTTTDLVFGTGSFTVEAWINPTSISGSHTVLMLGTYLGSNGIIFYISDGKLAAYCHSTGMIAPTATVFINTWTHIAFVRSGTTLKMYTNGVESYSVTLATDLSISTYVPAIGADLQFSSAYFQGYINDIRVTKGIARYTAAFIPPSLPNPVGYDAYAPRVVLHLPMNSDFTDGTGKTVTVAGNTSISTSTKKFGVGSGYFDGTGDYLSLADSTDFDFGSGDFTIETWIYPTVAPSVAGGVLNKRLTAAVYAPFNISFLASRAFEFSVSLTGSSWITLQSSPLILNTWTHVACVRSGNTILLFINGTLVTTNSTLSTTALVTNTSLVTIGTSDTGSQYPFTGHFDDFRITKGVARYTATFKPPIEPFSLT